MNVIPIWNYKFVFIVDVSDLYYQTKIIIQWIWRKECLLTIVTGGSTFRIDVCLDESEFRNLGNLNAHF